MRGELDMKQFIYLAVAVSFLSACATEELADVIVPGDTCGSDGARVQATVAGNDWCANASVLGVGDGSSVTITGINLLGGTLVLQLDSLATGVQPINEVSNGVMYMNASLPYTPLNSDPGVLTIATLDTTAHRVKGSFEVTLHAAGGGSKAMNGAFDVQYTQQ
jgi:hypothetical protein